MKQGSLAHRSRMRHPRKTGNFVRNQTFDSNGGDVKIRGNPQQIIDKYLGMARDAHSSGDRVAAEHYFQHAEHYYRLSHHATLSDQRERHPSNTIDDNQQPAGNQNQENSGSESVFADEDQGDPSILLEQENDQGGEYMEKKPDGMMLPPALINGAVVIQPSTIAPVPAPTSEEILPEASQKIPVRRGRHKLTLAASPVEQQVEPTSVTEK
ncbi:MAG: DUF4167 domain-containing protein [Rhodospirillaceae bacterium]|nr:DUF4167 domain-containing protein [Rhodospirillaceae bacterium]